MKKIKITESQLKMIMERRHSFVAQETDESVEMEQNEGEECEECDSKDGNEEEADELMNESVEKIKASFKRFF
jgi:hypothetical protein